uniref:GLE1 RNA export mediator n=1 Tax=Syphacia muris TaxID=451379 RepID=A0A0N5A7Q4_9BILA
MEEFAVNELQAYGIAIDDTLLAYSGPPIRISNGIVAFLKQRYGVKQSFSIFRRLIGIILEDDYRGEILDRNAFRRKVRLLLEKYEKLKLNKDDSNAFLAEEFVLDFQFMDKAVKEADKRKSLRCDKGSSNVFSYPKSSTLTNGESILQLLPAEQNEQILTTEAGAASDEGLLTKRRRGRKRKVFERRPRANNVRRVLRFKNNELIKSSLRGRKRLKIEEQQPKLTPENKLLSNSEGDDLSQEVKIPEADLEVTAPADKDDSTLKIVEHDDLQTPISASGNGDWVQKTLRREKFAKKRIQVLSYKLRDEKLSLQEALRKLKQLERANAVRLETSAEAKNIDWKLKSSMTSKELESARSELDKLHQVTLKSNGKFIEDLRPCLKHLINVGVPVDKCGEVLVIVGALLGKTLVADCSNLSCLVTKLSLMIGRTHCYGISDEELLCDDCSAVVVSFDVKGESRDCFYKSSYSSCEESSVRHRLEEFVRQRNEYHNATILSVASYIDSKITNTSQSSTKDKTVRQEKFSRLSSFLEALSKEASGVKIESVEISETPLDADIDNKNDILSFTESKTSVKEYVPSSGASFQFNPAKFSTPKQYVSHTSQPSFSLSLPDVTPVPLSKVQQLSSQIPSSANRSGHLILKRTDSIAEELTCCSSNVNLSNVSFASENNNNNKLQSSRTLLHTWECDQIISTSHTTNKVEANSDTSLLESTTARSEKQLIGNSFSSVVGRQSIEDTSKVKKNYWWKQLPFFEFFEVDNLSEAYVTEFDKRPKDVLHALAKRSVKEKVACWTRKNASKEVIKNAVEYFCDLLTGKTVYGFDGKMLNFNGDEPGKRFSMASVVNSYVCIVQRDEQLTECVAVVLLSLMTRIKEFKSVLFNRLFAASPLLCMDQKECLREIAGLNKSDGGNISEAVDSWCNSQSAVIKLFVLLHSPTIRCSVAASGDTECNTTTLWSLLSVAIMQETPYGCALVNEILKSAGEHLRKLYGVQFHKLLEFLSHKTLKNWNRWLNNETSSCGLMKMALSYYVAVLKLELKELSVQ